VRRYLGYIAVDPAQQFPMPLCRFRGHENLDYFPRATPGLFEQMRALRRHQAIFGWLACARSPPDSL
jgi:hypothetical protein